MLLTFSKDMFVDQIKAGTKIHTIRVDKSDRWRPGRSIQFWRGNPRNVKSFPYQFMVGECKSVQAIHIFRQRIRDENNPSGVTVKIYSQNGWIELKNEEIEELAKNDGLTIHQLREWFVPWQEPTFTGKIIHWTDKIY